MRRRRTTWARFVALVRSLSIDPIVVRQNWLDAYDYTTDKGAAVLNDYARVNDPFARIGKESVTVQITSVTRASDASFNVRWTETPLRQRCAGWHWSGGTAVVFHRAADPAHRSSACARTPWASTSTACRGAANWILPKEQSHECIFP